MVTSKGLRKYETLKECMEKYANGCPADEKTLDRILEFKIHWIGRSPIHAEFLASNLTGCYPIRFSPEQDELKLYTDVFVMDRATMHEEIHSVKGIDTSWNVASNPTYHILVFLLHRFAESKLPDSKKSLAMREIYYITAFKMLGSLDSHFFNRGPVDKGLAEAVYNNLSEKFLIKNLGSWDAVLSHRADTDVLKGGNFYKQILEYKDAVVIMKVISALQGRLRSLIKNIWVEIAKVQESESRIYTSKVVTVSGEGEATVADIAHQEKAYIDYMRSIVFKPSDFLKDDYVLLVAKIVGNIRPEKLRQMLYKISTEPDYLKGDYIGANISASLGYLREKGVVSGFREQVVFLIKALKGFWSSVGVRDKELRDLKEECIKATITVTGNKVRAVATSIAMGFLIYVFIRALFKPRD